jgi:hypothetical protein
VVFDSWIVVASIKLARELRLSLLFVEGGGVGLFVLVCCGVILCFYEKIYSRDLIVVFCVVSV